MTRIELLAVILCAAPVLAMGQVVMDADKPGVRTMARSVKDGTQLSMIHKVMIIYAKEYAGQFPRPGLINRLPTEINGEVVNVPGRGEEDVTVNTTANLYSSLVVQSYFGPDLLISPLERNPNVREDNDYDWNRYDPMNDVYWDSSFTADLTTESNVSFAHMPIFGERATTQWKETFDAQWIVFGNRGPIAGERNAESFTCGPHGHWGGNVVFQDNRVELRTEVTAERHVEPDDQEKSDNFFHMEAGPHGDDMIITFTRAVSRDDLKIQHD